MTIEQFDAWINEESHAEFLDGKVFLMSPVSRKHADLQTLLIAILAVFVQRKSGGSVRGPEFQMRFPTRRFEPDVVYLATANATRAQETYLDGPADMVMEIVSPESADRDWYDKFSAYAEGGVKEYWIIDPLAERVECCVLTQGKYHALPSVNGKISSQVVPEFFLREEWLWALAAPDVVAILEEFGVIRQA